MQQVARDVENGKISQIIYLLMQGVDVKKLKVNFVVSGSDQRKIYMLGVDEGKDINLQKAIYLYTPIIPSLNGKGKMSSSDEMSFISIRDDKELIKRKVNRAYCEKGDVKKNPILSIVKFIIFPKFEKLIVRRDGKFGGDIVYGDYKKLEKEFESGKLHALDLKNAVSDALEKLISPIRANWKQ